ncbi:MAG: hypothetical protein ABIO51_06190 [Solirubrobacteraceae bacterium]
MSDRYARSRAKDEAVRDGLEPLAKGERPGAVTVAATVAFVMAVANLVAAATGADLGNEATSFTIFSTLLLLACAGGMWLGARYWAVLGFMMVLAFQILSISIALIRVERWWVGLILVAIVGLLGLLFFKLIRALARIQMPERPLR